MPYVAQGDGFVNSYKFTDHDKKIYLREANRLEMSLESVRQQQDMKI